MITPLIASLLFSAQQARAYLKAGPWISLTNGRDLAGWSVKNGTATYQADGHTITGFTASGSPNTFLATDRMFADFELEFEVKVDDKLNSGVQIRSRGASESQAQQTGGPEGTFGGPQIEIEAGPGQAGYIYGEAIGGWLSPEATHPDPKISTHNHFRNGAWNRYRILAIGPRIRTWVNGHQIADLVHEASYTTHPKGRIGLQVHSIGPAEGPYQVAWRGLRLREYSVVFR